MPLGEIPFWLLVIAIVSLVFTAIIALNNFFGLKDRFFSASENENTDLKAGVLDEEWRYEPEKSPMFNTTSVKPDSDGFKVVCYQTRIGISILKMEPLADFQIEYEQRTFFDKNDINEPVSISFCNVGDLRHDELPFRVTFSDTEGQTTTTSYRLGRGGRFRVIGA